MRYLLLLLLVLTPFAQAETGFAKLERGQYGVGFRVVQQYDYSRSYKDKTDTVQGLPTVGERARPIQTLIWYPAVSSGTRMPYAAYIRTEATDEQFERPKAELDAFVADKLKSISAAIGEKQAQAMFAQTMWAVRDAAPLAGKYPVVIYAAGGGSAAHDSADLAEYLASHGYVVIVSRNMGTRSYQMNFDLEGANTQARDIGFLVSYAHTLPFADTAHIAAAGWSWGGMSNVFAAAADSRISAIISLDGTREPELTKTIAPSRVAIPWLYVSRRLATISDLNQRGVETSFSLLNALTYSQLYQVVMNPMQHADFSTFALRVRPASYFGDYSREEVEQAYNWTARYILEFSNAYLKGDPAGLAFLKRTPAENGLPSHMAQIERREARQDPPPTRASFAAELAGHGFNRAVELYGQLHKRDAAFALDDSDINAWAYQLVAAKDPKDAIEILKLGVSLYPDNSNLHDSLGEIYEIAGDKPAATLSYQRSLALDPKNQHAVQRLQALK